VGHVVDPRTGWPTEGTTSVTVRAATAELADGLATAFLVGGAAEAPALAAAFPEAAVLLVGRDGARWTSPGEAPWTLYEKPQTPVP
jgi:FAD:protein FMN transferase